MEIRELDLIVHGKRYRTAQATQIARELFPDEEGADTTALATTILFRTAKGNYFRQIQSQNAIIRDQIEPILHDEAFLEYQAMPIKILPPATAFPEMNSTEEA